MPLSSVDVWLPALALPPESAVNKRIPKALLAQHAGFTAADRRLILRDLEEATWLAALKPAAAGVTATVDAERSYLEIDVLHVRARDAAKSARLVELIHRAVPHPVVLFVAHAAQLRLSLWHKRRSLAAHDAVVLDGDGTEVDLDADVDSAFRDDFREALALHAIVPALSARTTLALYRAWIGVCEAVHVANLTGTFAPLVAPTDHTTRTTALRTCERLLAEMAMIRKRRDKASQFAEQLACNEALAGLQREHLRQVECLRAMGKRMR